MSTIDDLIKNAKDEPTKALLKQAKDLAEKERKAMEKAHAKVLADRDRQDSIRESQHQAAISARDEGIARLQREKAQLERQVTNQNIEIASKNDTISQYSHAYDQQSAELAAVRKKLNSADGWALLGKVAATTLLVGGSAKALSKL